MPRKSPPKSQRARKERRRLPVQQPRPEPNSTPEPEAAAALSFAAVLWSPLTSNSSRNENNDETRPIPSGVYLDEDDVEDETDAGSDDATNAPVPESGEEEPSQTLPPTPEQARTFKLPDRTVTSQSKEPPQQRIKTPDAIKPSILPDEVPQKKPEKPSPTSKKIQNIVIEPPPRVAYMMLPDQNSTPGVFSQILEDGVQRPPQMTLLLNTGPGGTVSSVSLEDEQSKSQNTNVPDGLDFLSERCARDPFTGGIRSPTEDSRSDESMLERMSPIQMPHGGDSACDARVSLMGRKTSRTMLEGEQDDAESASLLLPIRKGRLRRINQNTSEKSVGFPPPHRLPSAVGPTMVEADKCNSNTSSIIDLLPEPPMFDGRLSQMSATSDDGLLAEFGFVKPLPSMDSPSDTHRIRWRLRSLSDNKDAIRPHSAPQDMAAQGSAATPSPVASVDYSRGFEILEGNIIPDKNKKHETKGLSRTPLASRSMGNLGRDTLHALQDTSPVMAHTLGRKGVKLSSPTLQPLLTKSPPRIIGEPESRIWRPCHAASMAPHSGTPSPTRTIRKKPRSGDLQMGIPDGSTIDNKELLSQFLETLSPRCPPSSREQSFEDNPTNPSSGSRLGDIANSSRAESRSATQKDTQWEPTPIVGSRPADIYAKHADSISSATKSFKKGLLDSFAWKDDKATAQMKRRLENSTDKSLDRPFDYDLNGPRPIIVQDQSPENPKRRLKNDEIPVSSSEDYSSEDQYSSAVPIPVVLSTASHSEKDRSADSSENRNSILTHLTVPSIASHSATGRSTDSSADQYSSAISNSTVYSQATHSEKCSYINIGNSEGRYSSLTNPTDASDKTDPGYFNGPNHRSSAHIDSKLQLKHDWWLGNKEAQTNPEASNLGVSIVDEEDSDKDEATQLNNRKLPARPPLPDWQKNSLHLVEDAGDRDGDQKPRLKDNAPPSFGHVNSRGTCSHHNRAIFLRLENIEKKLSMILPFDAIRHGEHKHPDLSRAVERLGRTMDTLDVNLDAQRDLLRNLIQRMDSISVNVEDTRDAVFGNAPIAIGEFEQMQRVKGLLSICSRADFWARYSSRGTDAIKSMLIGNQAEDCAKRNLFDVLGGLEDRAEKQEGALERIVKGLDDLQLVLWGIGLDVDPIGHDIDPALRSKYERAKQSQAEELEGSTATEKSTRPDHSRMLPLVMLKALIDEKRDAEQLNEPRPDWMDGGRGYYSRTEAERVLAQIVEEDRQLMHLRGPKIPPNTPTDGGGYISPLRKKAKQEFRGRCESRTRPEFERQMQPLDSKINAYSNLFRLDGVEDSSPSEKGFTSETSDYQESKEDTEEESVEGTDEESVAEEVAFDARYGYDYYDMPYTWGCTAM